MTDIAELTDQIAALEATLGGTVGMVSSFEAELTKMQDSLVFTGKEVGSLANGFSGGLRRAFDGVVFDGIKLSDALKGVAKSMADTVFNTAMKPVTNALGGFLAGGLNAALSGGLGFAKGGAFTQGRVMPFAQGGIVSSPTQFPMRGGAGLMGEAGPEAIMPLTRGPDGKLGVRSAGGGGAVTVVMNISTPDVAPAIALDWVRRTRIDGDTWAGVEVPLGEDAELYQVQVKHGATLLREELVATPAWVYTPTMQSTDAAGASFSVWVAQVSNRFGPGPAKEIVIS